MTEWRAHKFDGIRERVGLGVCDLSLEKKKAAVGYATKGKHDGPACADVASGCPGRGLGMASGEGGEEVDGEWWQGPMIWMAAVDGWFWEYLPTHPAVRAGTAKQVAR